MKVTIAPIRSAILAVCLVALAGCQTHTTIRLTGTPGAKISGHYRADHVSTDFTGGANWKLQLDGRHLHEFEFRKSSPEQSVALEIRRGRKNVVGATAEPGISGLRVSEADGWKVEKLK